MYLIWFCTSWLIGIFAGAFFLIQTFIVLLFGIPFTIRLRRLGIMRGRGPLIEYLVSLVAMPLLFCGISAGINAWLPEYVVGYWVGVGIALLLGVGKCGANSYNMQDYLRSNARDIDNDALGKYFPQLK